jgi:glutamine amidotransferase
MIAIIDYGMGNLRSVEKALEKIGEKALVTNKISAIKKAEKIILPGVGAFQDCMDNLKKLKLTPVIKESIAQKKPFLGICLGLQLLFSYSEEGKGSKGLNLFKGSVKKFKKKLKVPHMGWNKIKINKRSPLLKDIPNNSYVYFVHSYYVDSEEKDIILTKTYYGLDFTSSICKGNTFALQFHPEKSQDIGLKILKNFSKISS